MKLATTTGDFTLYHGDYAGQIRALYDAGYKGVFTFESCSSLRRSQYWLGNRRPFEGECLLSEPTLWMQEELEKLLYRMGVYILQSYDCFEE